jgi:hypothetical protein
VNSLKNNTITVIPILITSFILALIGWAGLYFLMETSQPYLGARWLWFFLFTLAITGTALPIVYFLNKRFPSKPGISTSSLIRQAVWVAVFFDLLAWLQLGRILNPLLALVLAIGLIIIENLIRMVEKARWQPVDEDNE